MPVNPLDDRKNCEAPAAALVQPLPPGVRAGAPILVRGDRYRLDATITRPDCHELHLTRAADGRRRILLWPFDRPAAVTPSARLRVVRVRRWRAALEHIVARTIDPLTPRAAGGDVDIVPYQLAPAIAMAAGTSRLLLADEVGLGKTIQAGWIVSDLVARDPDARVLLAVPAGLRQQWAAELTSRFGLVPVIVDARWLRHAIADLPADVSPWTAPGVYIGSLDFLKRPDVVPAITRHVWDLLVVDEAHTATAPTDRHAAIRQFASAARRLIAITATPYSGNSAGFASMAGLGAGPGSPPPLMFRRSRADVGDPRQRRHHFARIRITAVEVRFQRMLERYSREVWNEPHDDRDGARLAVTILRKRALSSAGAAARSLRRRLDLLQGRAQVPRQLALFDDDEAIDDEVATAALAAPGLADAAREHRCLAALVAAADAAANAESKLRYLHRLILRLRGESIVVFTEYRDTLLQLARSLPPSLHLHGGLAAAERVAVQRRFTGEGGLLLATDAAAEGLNLQQRCRLVINYELPWNPARLEQRIGRVDRIGQRRVVHALTLTARDTAEDLVLGNLTRRLSRIVATLGPDDRLGLFLDDVRTAGIVIGGEPPEVNPPAAEPGGAIRADSDLRSAALAAAQIALRRHTPQSRLSSSPGVVVSSIRSMPATLPPGFVVIVSTTARTGDGVLVAARSFYLHLRGRPERPHTAAATRQLADALLTSLDAWAVVPGLDAWFAEVRRVHDTAIDARLVRERDLGDRRQNRHEVQPGLFDRRAVAAADRALADAADVAESHRRQIESLERSRHLHLTCSASAVLILWR
jgi:superfamily II DNA or RNA helicase